MLRAALNSVISPIRRYGLIARFAGDLRAIRADLIVVVVAIGIVSRLLLPGFALSQESEEGLINREYPLKALFIYNFASYIEWPQSAFADSQSPFVIGVLGTSLIDDTLNQISASKQIAGRKIVVSHFVSVSDIKPCQILFIPHSLPPAQQRQAIEALKNLPVLIVGESDGFAALGGDVNFFVQANRIRFEINLTVMKQQDLKASSKLLAMAKIVESAPVQR